MTDILLDKKSESIEMAAFRAVKRNGANQLHLAASKLVGGSPSLKAATSLHRALRNGGNVLITSGFTIIRARRCETDGPLGSAVLGRLLNNMSINVIFLTDSSYLTLFERVSKAAGLNSFQCSAFPIEEKSAKEKAVETIADFSPVAIVAIERPGWNKHKVYHNMMGENISDCTGKVDYLINEAIERGILTIGIGDGGNEIGMGNVLQTVVENVPFGSVCQCPCRGGIASVTKADHLIVSSISNWGAYILTALTASLADMPFSHGPDDERRLIRAAVDAGAVDGVSGKSVEAVDGLTSVDNSRFVKKISGILAQEKMPGCQG
jgi:hypothetical protein